MQLTIMCYVRKDSVGRGKTVEDKGGEKRRGNRAFLSGEMGDVCPCINFEATGDMGSLPKGSLQKKKKNLTNVKIRGGGAQL